MTAIIGSGNLIQQESVQFNQPVSEASASSIGALANYLREVILPVGSIVSSMLDQPTFQNECLSSTTWVLADGKAYPGSRYEFLTSNTNVPDLRGIFVRGNNFSSNTGSRSTSTGNPDGNLAVGTYSADKYNSHNHGVTDPAHNHTLTDPSHFHTYAAPSLVAGAQTGGGPGNTTNVNASQVDAATTGITLAAANTGVSINNSGGNETAPRNVTVNYFIRIN